MGDDIQMGAINEAGAETNLVGRVNSDGTWPGDFVFNVEAQVLVPRAISGIRAVGQAAPGRGGLVPAGFGVHGTGDNGVVGEGQTVGVIGRPIGSTTVVAAGVFGQGARGNRALSDKLATGMPTAYRASALEISQVLRGLAIPKEAALACLARVRVLPLQA